MYTVFHVQWLANPLYAAVDRKNLEMVKLLVKWDADVHQADNSVRIFYAFQLNSLGIECNVNRD
jgi:hypothetical protein